MSTAELFPTAETRPMSAGGIKINTPCSAVRAGKRRRDGDLVQLVFSEHGNASLGCGDKRHGARDLPVKQCRFRRPVRVLA